MLTPLSIVERSEARNLQDRLRQRPGRAHCAYGRNGILFYKGFTMSAMSMLMLCAFILAVVFSYASATPCATISISLDMPVAEFGAFEAFSQGYLNDVDEQYAKLAFTAALQVNNRLTLAGTPPVHGNAPVNNLTVIWPGAGCYQINVVPNYLPVFADIIDDSNVGNEIILANQLCAHDSNNAPQIISAIDATLTNSMLYTSLALACNAYGIPTVSTLYNDLGFADKANFPLSARGSVRLDTPNLLLINLMQQYGWTRVALFAAAEPSIPNLVTILQGEAVSAGIDLMYLSIPVNNRNCSSYMEQAFADDRRVFFFLGLFSNLAACEALVMNQQALGQNYIIVNSFDTYSSGGFTPQYFAASLNISQSMLKGTFVVQPVTDFGSYMTTAFGYQQAIDGMPTSLLGTDLFLIIEDAVTLVNQGTLGMLGNRLQTAIPAASQALSHLTPSAVNSTLNAQTVVNTILNAISVSGAVGTYNFAYSNGSGSASVPFSSMRYNTSQVFYYFTNASGMYLDSAALGKLIHGVDGESLVKNGIYNFDESNLNVYAIFNMVDATFTLANQSVSWPNASALSPYINNGFPADRLPTSSILLTCPPPCTTTQFTQLNPSTTVYKELPMVSSAYQLTIAQDDGFFYTINVKCDGTAPRTQSLYPTINNLSGTTSNGNLGIMSQSAVNSVTIYASTLVSAMKTAYQQYKGLFNQIGQTPDILNFSYLEGVQNAAAITGVVDGAANAFNVEFLVNCNNGVANVSSVLRISILSLPDIYTPSVPAQNALIALNSVALGMAALVGFLVVKHRDERAIFSSSFLFLLIIVIGFILLFTSSLLGIIPATDALCQAKLITFHFGFTTALGAIFVKNFRLHRIFNSKNLLNMTISNRILVSAVLGLLLVDAIVLATWIGISGFGIESGVHPHCYTSGYAASIFAGVFAGLKGLILFGGIYLTFKVRAVPANFNESKFIAVVIYNTSVLAVVYIVVFFAFNLQPNELTIFTSVMTFLGALVGLCIFFSPKLLALKNLYLKNDSSSGSTRSSWTKKANARTRSKDKDRERELQISNASTLSELQSDHTVEEKTTGGGGGSLADSAAGKEKEKQGDETERETKDKDKEKQRTAASVTKRLKGLKDKFLTTVISAKRANNEHNRLLLRAAEVRRWAEDYYDQLRTQVMDIRLNTERLKKMLNNADEANNSTPAEAEQQAAILKETLALIELPIDQIQLVMDDSSHLTVAGLDSARGPGPAGASSRKTVLHIANNSSNTNASSMMPNLVSGVQMSNIKPSGPATGSLGKLPPRAGLNVTLASSNEPGNGNTSPHSPTGMHYFPRGDEAQTPRNVAAQAAAAAAASAAASAAYGGNEASLSRSSVFTPGPLLGTRSERNLVSSSRSSELSDTITMAAANANRISSTNPLSPPAEGSLSHSSVTPPGPHAPPTGPVVSSAPPPHPPAKNARGSVQHGAGAEGVVSTIGVRDAAAALTALRTPRNVI